MKRFIVIATFLMSIFSANAEHVLGGEITWECQGNNEYVFQLVLYNDCSDLPISATAESISWSGGAPISCVLDTNYIISPTCGNGAYAIVCDSTVFYSPVKRYVYRSAPTVLLGKIPAVGWTFWHFQQARPNTDNTTGGATNGYTLRANMYPFLKNGVLQSATNCYDNSPKFEEKPRYAFNSDTNFLLLDGYDVDSEDSIYFGWAEPLDYALSLPGSPLTFEQGYAYNQPLPGPGININNSGATLYSNGLLTFKSTTQGRFTTCYKIESYRDGQLIAEVYRDFEMQINSDPGSPGICGGASNSAPSITFNSVTGFSALNPVYESGVLTHYETTVFSGETVNFTVTAQDVDLNPNCTPQLIAADVNGDAISESFLGSTDCDGPPCANLISLNGGGGYVSSLNNTTRLLWDTDTAHAFGPNGVGMHWFHFNFNDGHCVLPGIGEAKVLVNVLRPIYAPVSNFKICDGDTAYAEVLGQNTNLTWSPSMDISCTNCANPKFYPTTNTTYTATDNATGFTLEIDVIVDAPAAIPVFTQNGANLELGNPSAYDTIVWRRSGAPFYPQPINTYTPWLTGDYWVDGGAGVCAANSDTISVAFADNMSAVASTNGKQNDMQNGSKTYGATVRLNNEAFYRIDGFYVHAFSKNAQGANLGNLTCKIYNQSQALVYQSDSVSRVSDDILKFHGEANLPGNQDFLISFYVDTSVVVPTFAPVVWPVVANNGRVLVYNATSAAGDFYPATSAVDYPFFHFSLKWGIGLAEDAIQNVRCYPNPAKDVLHLESASKVEFVITNAVGQTLANGSLNEEKTLDVSTWKSGFYIINFRLENGTSRSEKLEILR